MEIVEQKKEKFTQSLTFKAITVVALTLLLLIPNAMIQGLISERQQRSRETINQINEKWSLAQTLCPPVLVVPYTTTVKEKIDDKMQIVTQSHKLYIMPENAEITAQILPEERHLSIYKSIVYKSDMHISGNFVAFNNLQIENSVLHFDKAYISLEISDLRGIMQEIDFTINGKKLLAKAGARGVIKGKSMIFALDETALNSALGFSFDCTLKLKGSNSIYFIPVAKNTKVSVSGNWTAPGFIGNFLPEYKIDEKAENFSAEWNILSFNRSIPEKWSDINHDIEQNSFGVDLVQTIDHYQQNMRSAKYALMFIALTFVVFFFIETITKRRIHPVQYLLVGIALILFYSLLLSISEQIGFALAYLIASAATISLIVIYAAEIFKLKKATFILATTLATLYTFLYVVLQLEDLALLIGSLGLFLILGIIMFISRKVQWYK
ncbi:MAG: cell envelope integrity protein CreD [Prevotellaceae bacterium]|jgi:inner membrane protein|nr:cell envelope integrity protein CreD [Prevotellaceae bacterium]